MIGKNLKIHLAAVCLSFLSALAPAVGARTIYVDDDGLADFANIQAAVDDASSSDTIVVRDGTYIGPGNRDMDFKGKAITVRSENGPQNCIIACNGTADDNHRAFYFHSDENDQSVLDGFTIMNGYAAGTADNRHGGGAIRCDNSSPGIINCIFIGNRAAWDGGAINNYLSNPRISGCTFVRNQAIANDGGAINNDNSSPVITNCTFEENSAYDWGGAIRNIYDSHPVISNCLFARNQARGSGGAIYIHHRSTTEITNCLFARNQATYGGAIYINYHCTTGITNCLFAHNQASHDGAIGIYNYSTAEIRNCTLADNLATYASAIYCAEWSECRATITNSIIWGNQPKPLGGTQYTISYSDIKGGWLGTGNMNSDPRFAHGGYVFDPCTPDDPCDDMWVIGDYHLGPGSPCIDAGNNLAVPASLLIDLDGGDRFADDPCTPDTGRGTPPIVDMGAYEGTTRAAAVCLSTYALTVPEGQTALLTVWLSTDPLAVVEVQADVYAGDQDITIADGAVLIFDSSNYSQPQTVTLSAADDHDPLNGVAFILISAPQFIPAILTATEADNEVVPAILFVDPDAPGADDGTSWLDACSDLQVALRIAASFPEIVREIRVAQGLYTPAEAFSGDREACFEIVAGGTLKGGYAGFGNPDPNVRNTELYETILSGDLNGDDIEVSDPCDLLSEPTRFDNSYNVVRYRWYGAPAIVDGVTITGANAGGGAAVHRSGGGVSGRAGLLLSHCKIAWNAASDIGGGVLEGSLVHCTVSHNSASVAGAVYGPDELSHCIIEDNVATGYYAGAVYVPWNVPITDCAFINNRAAGGGGAIWALSANPVMARCSFIGNRATGPGGAIGVDGCSTCQISQAEMRDCVFVRNFSDDRGGVYYGIAAAEPLWVNCLLAGNAATLAGGAIYENAEYRGVLINCTIASNTAASGGGISAYGCSPTLKDCIVWGNRDGDSEYLAQLAISPGNTYPSGSMTDSPATAAANHCCIQDMGIQWGGYGNIDEDPCFADPGRWEDPCDTPDDFLDDTWVPGDYHLKSQAGRWDPTAQSWVMDDVTSPCIDAGDPMSPIGLEPFPNGGRINMGAYGGTAEASKSHFGGPPCETIVAGDINGDCKVDLADFAILSLHWLETPQ